MRDVFTGATNGALLAKSFFEDLRKDPVFNFSPFGQHYQTRRQFALYKDANGPEGGILGFQFDVSGAP
jgi:hypothetical protein